MAFTIPPPPNGSDVTSPEWRDWFYKISRAFTTADSVSWGAVELPIVGEHDVLIGPLTGSDKPTFRQLELSDLPPLPLGAGMSGRDSVEGEDGAAWMGPPGNTPPPPNTTGLEIRQEITGVISGGLLTATVGTGVFSISDGTGQIVDNYSVPLQPSIKGITWSGLTNVVDSFLASPVVYIAIDSTGAVTQSTTFPDQDALRAQIGIGFLVHSGGAIQTIVPAPVLAYQNGYLAQDLLAALGTITNGCVYSGGTGLTLARTAGALFRKGGHYSVDLATPNEAILNAVNPATIVTHCRNGSNTVFSSSAGGTTIIVDRYDDGSAAAAGVPTGVVATNRWQAMRLFLSTTGVAVVQYGQVLYNSLADAQVAVSTESFFQAPLLTFSAFRGYMFVRGGAADLSSSSDAVFQSAGKLGDTSGAGSGAIGPSGPAGVMGPVGFGLDGEDGVDGFPIPGVPGPQGTPGAQGIQGSVGYGLDGADGEDGMPVPGSPGLQGATGLPGTDGLPGIAGMPGLDGSDGEDGMPIPGNPGIQGATGASGTNGLPGIPGLDGENGEDGLSIPGIPGQTGADGVPGLPGPAGIPGIPGLDGEDGADGLSIPGPSGLPGPQGLQGLTGNQGPVGPAIFLVAEDAEESVMGPPGPVGPAGSGGGGGVSAWVLPFAAAHG